MAPPPHSGQMRPSRYLFALLAIFVVLFGLVLGTGEGSLKERLEPKLGLDLIGGTTLTLVATTPDGSPPDANRLESARQIIQKRVDAFGVAEAEVVTEGNNHIVISVPGQNNDTVRQVGKTAQMRFRKVIGATVDSPAALPNPSASPSASPNPSVSPEPSPAAAEPSPEPSTAPAPSAEPTGSPSPAVAPSPTTTPRPELEAVIAKLGDAYTLANQMDPATFAAGTTSLISDTATMQQLEVFRELTPAEVAVLPYNVQFVVPQVTCEKLAQRPAGSIEDVTQTVVACQPNTGTKLLLDKAQVIGTDIADAQPALDSATAARWVVSLNFTSDGATRWNNLTREAFNNEGGACLVTQPNETGGANVCQVAVVLDNDVVSAPAIQAVMSNESQITGQFSKASATQLADQIRFGALPLTFEQGTLQSITATLGADYLRAGLLAMGIGLGLVIVYAFFYYRLLGLVITLSLVLSALLTFGMLVFLGNQMGFTLSLAGIAGFIVSLGVAADSFVIYFERLKDEIREGRSPRAAVTRAWIRARRTIITANAVTILAAVVLYAVGVGQVKGFAFALGLATALDLIIVFLFRHPMMTMLARTPAFLSPRVSGLGRVLHGVEKEA